MDIGPRRDLVGDLTKVVRNRGLKMGVYYSFFEWYNPLWLSDRPRFVREHMQPQLKDLITRYRPDLLWADGEWEEPEGLWRSREFLAWLFNESPAPEIVVNDRWGKECRHRHGGYYTTEFTPGMKDTNHPWEENRTITRPRAYDAEDRPLWYEWVYNRQLTADDFYSARELVLTLVDMVSRGGNLLLNVGPTPDGRLPEIEQERLIEIGEWLRINGEAIFGTRPWVISSQWTDGPRPTIRYNSEWREKYDIAAIAAKPRADRAVIEAFFTSRGGTVYAILPWWPVRRVVLKRMKPSAETVVTMLGLEGPLTWKEHEDGVSVETPRLDVDALPCRHAYVLKLTRMQPRQGS